MRSSLGVKDDVSAGEDTDKGEVNKVEEVGVGAEAGKGELNKLEG